MLLFDVVVLGTRSKEVIDSVCTSKAAETMAGTRSQTIAMAKSGHGGHNRCFCRLQQEGIARLCFWSITSFNDVLPDMTGVSLHSAGFVFVPALDGSQDNLAEQLNNLEMRMSEVKARAKRADADAKMVCLPLDPQQDEMQMLPSKRRMELRAWCKEQKVKMVGQGEAFL